VIDAEIRVFQQYRRIADVAGGGHELVGQADLYAPDLISALHNLLILLTAVRCVEFLDL
jgi:hypothetical protein